ncbi:MAG: SPFH domain-containing protein [Thermoguttaceae bacterium]|nr:SPFH domain-containing protein [Thermoguttaceae bacterium]
MFGETIIGTVSGTLSVPIVVCIILALFLLMIVISCVRIVPQSKEYVIERLGSFHTIWKAGLHVLTPVIDRIVNQVSMKENVLDYDPQPVITKDNVTIQIDSVVFYQVTDSEQYTYGANNPINVMRQLTATTLRNVVGEMDLDETLTSRDVINGKITRILDEATDKWGIKVNRVELKNILPPKPIQEAMEKQMKAERERREAILQAEGRKKSEILIAEGEKQAQILRAEAEKEQAILKAQAEKEKQVLEATGRSEAILLVQKAIADGIKMLNESNPSQEVLTLKSLEAFTKAADGKATKLIIPSQIQGIAGLASALKEIVKE